MSEHTGSDGLCLQQLMGLLPLVILEGGIGGGNMQILIKKDNLVCGRLD